MDPAIEQAVATVLIDPQRKKKAAAELADRIRKANLYAKVAFTKEARKQWYRVKASWIGIGLKYSEYYSVVSYELDGRGRAILLCRIGDGGMVHVPAQALASGLIELTQLPEKVTLSSKGSPTRPTRGCQSAIAGGFPRNRRKGTMNSTTTSFIGFLMFIASAVFIASCGQTKAPEIDLPPISAECRIPVKVAVIVDESASMATSGTAPVKADELHPLIDALAECGGALGIGFVREAPQPGLERIEFPRPPLLPAAPVMFEDEQTYEFDDRVAAFNQLRLERANSIKNALENKKPEIDGYFRKIDDLLARPAAKGTDLNSGLNAADLFLSEPVKEPGWQKALIIISDGLDNGRKPRRHIRSEARVLWVNSTSNDKVLSDYGATRVEALKAAVDDVINKLQTRGTK